MVAVQNAAWQRAMTDYERSRLRPASAPTPLREPAVDVPEMERFVAAVFKHVPPAGFIALRAFEHSDRTFPVAREWAPVGRGLARVAAEEATRIGRLRNPTAVFCPPICVFSGEPDQAGKRRARAQDVLVGPVISVELDERPREALAALAEVLGPPTVTVRSGGRWTRPDGAVEDKLHAHWRLTVPAQGAAALAKLVQVRRMAAHLVGADLTAVPIAHPLRWPGSLHTKDPAHPRLCRIDEATDCELTLEEAAGRLELQLFIAGIVLGPKPPAERRTRFKTEKRLTAEQLMACAKTVPNDGSGGWEYWNTIGLAFFDASHGGNDGLEAFHAWSAKADHLYDVDYTDTRWSHFASYPASDLSAGTLIHYAREADPTFMLPGVRPDPDAFFDKATKVADVAPRSAPEDGPVVQDHINRLNRAHAFVMASGRALVANEERDGRFSFSTRSAFEERYANDTVMIGERTISVAQHWFTHPKRRQYLGGVDFAPEGAPVDVFNLWRGFAVSPDPSRSCELFLAHLRDNVCRGVDAHFRWVVGFFAQMIQQPGKKPGVALVLRGGQGVGKSLVGEYVGLMFPRHHVVVSQPEHLTGRFNAHLASALMVQAEEAFWAGDRAAAGGALKDLVTSDRMRVEKKGVDAIEVRNNVRLLVTTNNRWAVPAGMDERRFAVFDVSDARQQDTAYFAAIHRELAAGGAAALLHRLKTFDLSTINLREIPQTVALLDQKLESASALVRWWFELLKRGLFGHGDGWPEEVGRDALFGEYRRFVLDLRERPVGDTVFGKELHGLCPSLGSRRPRGEAGRQRVYVLPPIERCRAEFEKAIRAPIAWEEA